MFFEILILALIQGICEFFPLSSSAQMKLFSHFFSISLKGNFQFFIYLFLHFGTISSALIFFRKKIKIFIFAFFSKELFYEGQKILSHFFNEILRNKFSFLSILFIFFLFLFLSFLDNLYVLSFFVLIYFLILVIYQLFFFEKDLFKIFKKLINKNLNPNYLYLFFLIKSYLISLLIAGTLRLNNSVLDIEIKHIALNLLLSGGFLFFSSLFYSKSSSSRKDIFKISLMEVILIGFIQGLAALPGFSRSGLTISAGLIFNWDKMLITQFSFLLALPTIFTGLSFEMIKNPFIEDFPLDFSFIIVLIMSFFLSFLIGLLALKALFYWVKKKNNFYPFAVFCILEFILIYFFT